jgi:biotin-dependent carboxylase-like uncharacterized protein
VSRLEILDGGPQTTVQDFPGRVGRMADGVSPAGPMDHFSFRVANLLVGNPDSAPGLELTLGGLRATADRDITVALCGTPVTATVDGEPLPLWEAAVVPAGAELRVRMSKGPGFRVYLAVAGGVDVPEIFGSRATHTLAGLGGFEGRALRRGDVLALGAPSGSTPAKAAFRNVPEYPRDWEIEVILGPQADPDYLTAADVKTLTSRSFRVDANSNRVGLRLEPVQFEWARKGGGIAGGHPSNILDDGYPPGGINMNGDTPVILGLDGPTSGGFVIVATVVHGALWKLGQVRPGKDSVRLRPVGLDEALELDRALDRRIAAAG